MATTIANKIQNIWGFDNMPPLLSSSSKPVIRNVLFDIGSRYTKVGFAGESAPKFILDFNIHHHLYETKRQLSVRDWVTILANWFVNIFTDHLLYKARHCRVAFCEPILAPTNFRQALGYICHNILRTSEVSLYNPFVVSMYVSGSLTGLYVDVGWCESRVIALVEGCPMFNTLVVNNLGVMSVCEEIGRRLGDSVPEQWKTLDCCESILHESCFVRSNDNNSEAEPFQFGSLGQHIIIQGNIRSHAADVLFGNDDLLNTNGATACGGIALLLLESLLKSDVNIRRAIISNVVIVGGGPMLPGFKHRLVQEVEALVGVRPAYQQHQSQEYHVLKSCIEQNLNIAELPFEANIATWVGGSLFSQLPRSELFVLTPEEFESNAMNDFLSLKKDQWVLPQTSLNQKWMEGRKDTGIISSNPQSMDNKVIERIESRSSKWKQNQFQEWVKMKINEPEPVDSVVSTLSSKLKKLGGISQRVSGDSQAAVAGVGVV